MLRHAPPVIRRRFPDDLRIVRLHLDVERLDCRERKLTEGALTEGMNGKDRGFLEGQQGIFQIFSGLGPDPEPVHSAEKTCGKRVRRQAAASIEAMLHFHHPVADTAAQFGSGRIGEGHHEDLIHREIHLGNQAHIKSADGPRLSRSCRCLDVGDPVKIACENIQRFHLFIFSGHAFPLFLLR